MRVIHPSVVATKNKNKVELNKLAVLMFLWIQSPPQLKQSFLVRMVEIE